MNQRILQVCGVVLGLLGGFALALLSIRFTVLSQPEPAYHAHADFAVMINGQPFDFSLEDYQSTAPCTISQAPRFIDVANAHGLEADANTNDLRQYLHLHDKNGKVLHSHKQGMTYSDFFHSLEMHFDSSGFTDDRGNSYLNTADRSWRFFVNNQEVAALLDQEIGDLDRVLFTYGSNTRSQESIDAELVAISHDACIYSQSCPQRGTSPLESCGAGTKSPWLLRILKID